MKDTRVRTYSAYIASVITCALLLLVSLPSPARTALADLPQVCVVTDSVRRALSAERDAADLAVLDPPRAGAGREIIDAISAAGVPRIIHIGCEAGSFARDVGLYLRAGYTVAQVRVLDSFPLTHHVECVAVLTR